MERAVLDQLVEFFNRRLDGYPTTLAEDEILVVYLLIFMWYIALIASTSDSNRIYLICSL